VALTLRGSRGSSDYGAHLASRAADLGATLGGPYERHELPALLAAADLVALPSIWPENAPFVIREAFAAGRPVIASDTPALRESVRDGVDGRLVDLGDAAAWAACLCELARDRDELAELCRGVRPPKTTAEDARELEQIYTDLAEHHSARRTRARARQPAHLAAFSQALEALEALPTGELVERALAGLAQLASRLGQQPMGLTQALVSAEGLRERLAARERTADWRAETERHGRAARADLRAGLADREQALSALEARQGQLSRELESVAGERDWLRRSSVDLQAELAWTGESLDDRRAHLTEAQARLRSADDGLQAALAERDDLCSALAQRESELRALRLDHAKRDESSSAHDELRRAYEPLCAAHEALGAAYNSLRGAHEALQLHESWLRGELLRVFEVVQNEDSGDCEASDEIESLVAQAFEGLQRWSTELDWRAGEMAAATEESQGLGARLLPSALQRRADSWRKPSRPSGEAPS
jgi:chromosome segregation ATPase